MIAYQEDRMTAGNPFKKISANRSKKENTRRGSLGVYLKANASLYAMVLPGFLILLVFSYFPMYGIVMAFQSFKPALGFFDSPYVGFRHFERLLNDKYFAMTFKNTLVLGIQTLLISFPAPILLALLLNEIPFSGFKRVVQTISYMPYFISTVIVVGILRDLLTLNDGVVNAILHSLGASKINFFSSANWFRPLYIGSGLWQGIGFSSIIYLAAISGVNPELYESAVIDGANRFKRALYITLPSILPTIVILFIFAVGGILGNDFQKILLMYSPAVYSTADVISTYVFRSGIEGASQSYASAVGLFMSVISLALLAAANYIARKTGETSLW